MDGFVYIMVNEFMPSCVKIGMTTKHPLARAAELYTTGVPGPFRVVFASWHRGVDKVENAVHAAFDSFRVSASREFFDVGIEDVIRFIMDRFVFQQFSVVDIDEVISDDVLEKIVEVGGLSHRACVTKILEFLPDDAIAVASEAYKAECEERAKTLSFVKWESEV